MLDERRESDRRAALRWLSFSVFALMLAGMFSLALIVGRVPPFSELVTDPEFFRRCLVVHVDLALIVWFYAVVAGLFQLLGSREEGHSAANRGLLPASVGVVAMVLSAGIPHAEPVLANYVPVVDHPLFVAGLVAFGVGVLSAVLSPRLVARHEEVGFFPIPDDARPGFRAAAVALVAAAATFYGAWLATPSTLEPAAYYELVAWGGGHVLQVASEAAMVAVWLVLLGQVLGREVIGHRRATWLFAALVTPHLAMPLLTLFGTTSPAYHVGATQLMRWGIFPVVVVVLALCLRELVRAHRKGALPSGWRDPRIIGFATSAGLAVTGFVIGALIRGSNTMIPAHYHASIGAVTVSFMTFGAVLLAPERFGLNAPGLIRGTSDAFAPWRPSWHRLQPALFGLGQLVFAVGFGMAGANGMMRKVYGAEQEVRGFVDWLGLGIMGIGGLVAVAGGLLFLAMIATAAWAVLRRRVRLVHKVATSSHVPEPVDGHQRRIP